MASTREPVGVAPAPQGREPNFVNPETRTGENVAVHTVMLFFVTLCVAIRLYTRQFITRHIGLDDYMCIVAFCLLIAYSGLLLADTRWTLGRHLWDITLSNFIYGNKIEVFAEFTYLLVSMTIKLSCLLFYRVIFGPNPILRRIIYGGMFFVTGTYIGLLFSSIFDCIPVQKHWNSTLPGHCLKSGSLAYSSGAINVVTDLFVVFLPLPIIWRLNMKLSKRLRIMSVFALGIIVNALSITRLAKTPLVFKETDATWELSAFAVYAILELDIGLICACLLAFPAFIDRYGPPLTTKLRSYSHTLRRRTTPGTSVTSVAMNSSGEGKISEDANSERRKLAEGTTTINMDDLAPESRERLHHSSYRARLERMESLQSLQTQYAIASNQVV